MVETEDVDPGFIVCGCQRHGYILMRDGEVSNDLLCQHQAYDAARQLLQMEYLNAEEFEQVMYEIRQSALPYKLDLVLQKLAETDAELDSALAASPALRLDPWRTPIGITEEENIECIHEFLDTFAPQTRQILQ